MPLQIYSAARKRFPAHHTFEQAGPIMATACRILPSAATARALYTPSIPTTWRGRHMDSLRLSAIVSSGRGLRTRARRSARLRCQCAPHCRCESVRWLRRPRGSS